MLKSAGLDARSESFVSRNEMRPQTDLTIDHCTALQREGGLTSGPTKSMVVQNKQLSLHPKAGPGIHFITLSIDIKKRSFHPSSSIPIYTARNKRRHQSRPKPARRSPLVLQRKRLSSKRRRKEHNAMPLVPSLRSLLHIITCHVFQQPVWWRRCGIACQSSQRGGVRL